MYITDIQLSRSDKEKQQLQSQGFKKIDVNLNQTGSGEAVHLLYKKEENDQFITRIQVSFNRGMWVGLANAGYSHLDCPITSGNFSVFLWFYQGTTEYDTKIVGIGVTNSPEQEVEKITSGWQRVSCNLSNINGQWVYLWVKREYPTYICDINATVSYDKDTDLFNEGYIRIDETTSCGSCGSNTGNNFIWYRQITDLTKAITDVKVSITDRHHHYKQEDYTLVKTNLNDGNKINPVYLWYKKGGPSPIKTMQLFLNPEALGVYEEAKVTVIEKDLNISNNASPRYLCVYQ